MFNFIIETILVSSLWHVKEALLTEVHPSGALYERVADCVE